ncbi:MAG: N-acetylmuramoyl-L-alanine amidase [Eubacteriales bacterium]
MKSKKADHRIRVLNSLQIPAVLIECGFLSNPEEAKLLASREYQKKIAFTVFISTITFVENDFSREIIPE